MGSSGQDAVGGVDRAGDRDGDRDGRIGPLLRATLLPAQASQALTLVLVAPVVPQLAEYFGGGARGALAAQLGVVFPFLGITVGGLFSGAAIRLCGLRRLILLACLMLGCGGAIDTVATALPLFLVGSALLGLGAALLTSGLSAVTAISLDGARRARLLGIQSATANAMNVVLGLASAALAERYGWRVPFEVFVVLALVMLALAALSIPRAFMHVEGPSVRFLPVLRLVWPICLAAGVAFAIGTAQSTELPFLLQQNGITTPTLRAAVTSFTTGFSFLGSLAFGFARGRLPERAWILTAGLFAAAGWALFAVWSAGLLQAFAGAALIGIGLGILVPLLFTAIMRAAPGAATGQGVGLLGAALFLGSFASPALTTPLRAFAGLSGLMAALAVLTLLLTAAAFAWHHRAARESA